MTAPALDPPRSLSRFAEDLRRAPFSTLAEAASRLGYAARGVVYLCIGAVALAAALDRVPRAEGALAALEALGDWPFGQALLWLTGLGLYGFAGWRALQSVFDADGQGRSAKALANRLGQAISGVVYGSMAVSVFALLDAAEDLGEADDRAKTQESVRALLDAPGGELWVMGLGLFVFGAGVGNIVQAFVRDFGKRLTTRGHPRRWAVWAGRIGYFARGIAFLPLGVFFFRAGFGARTEEATGLGGALQALEAQPFGGALLAGVALGLAAFGLFALVEARYRRLQIEEAVNP
ncbi:MAG: DUF1206 domain-containing protein [Phenylobacterium sp.]|uniref:DUF1206 domain-containing protein n=1 Tax=Phenylobacterium sp. TaxID=1871053 RepID=UPI003919FE81